MSRREEQLRRRAAEQEKLLDHWRVAATAARDVIRTMERDVDILVSVIDGFTDGDYTDLDLDLLGLSPVALAKFEPYKKEG